MASFTSATLQQTKGSLGRYWVEGKWFWKFSEAVAYAKRTGAQKIKNTDGWTPTSTATWVTACA